MADFLYTIKAHPTTYAGVEFRSRLEATWAAFFDICGVKWEYEPIDLDGWVPDFLIQGGNHSVGTLVEIKPVKRLDELDSAYVSKVLVQDGSYHRAIFGMSPWMESMFGVGDYYGDFVGWVLLRKQDQRGHTQRDCLWAEYLSDDMLCRVDPMNAWKHAQNTTRWKGPR